VPTNPPGYITRYMRERRAGLRRVRRRGKGGLRFRAGYCPRCGDPNRGLCLICRLEIRGLMRPVVWEAIA
jgi:hypothetical protein